MYQAPNNREWILKWFHGGRLADFADFIDNSLPELLKTVPREENSLSHRYYNYTYLLSDLHEWFDTVSVYGWPVAVPGIPKLILFIAAE